jgi:pyrroline-5-carboxylate reductase
MQNLKLGFIGGGHIAQAMISGLILKNFSASNILVSAATNKNQLKFNELKVKLTTDNVVVAKAADIILLCVPAKLAVETVKALDAKLNLEDKILVSCAALISIAELENAIASVHKPNILRCMPNITVSIATGISLLYSRQPIPTNVTAVFELISQIKIMPSEQLLEQATFISGCGPGYIFYLLNAIVDAAMQLGFDRHIALDLVLQMTISSAHYAKRGSSLEELYHSVCSEGGLTEHIINNLKQAGIANKIKSSITQASQQLKPKPDDLLINSIKE